MVTLCNVVCICMLLMQVKCGCQILASSRMQTGTKVRIRRASNRRHASNRVHPLLVPQWPQLTIKSAMRYVKARIRFVCNGRCATLSVSPISVIMIPTDNQIGHARPLVRLLLVL
jgi:hypothetical protein